MRKSLTTNNDLNNRPSMKKVVAAGLAALTLGGSLSAAGAADAQARYHGYYGHRGYDRGGTALAAGIAGLAIGAAVAGQPRYYGAYPAYGYGYGPRYYAPYAYYGPRPYYRTSCFFWRHDRWGRAYRVRTWC